MLRPTSLDEALAARRDRGCTVVAGGTVVMVDLNRTGGHGRDLLDLSRIPELRSWERVGDHVRVGSCVTLTECLERHDPQPALRQACRAVASRAVRNRATVGGNVVTGSPAGDLLPFLVASDAVASIQSTERGVVRRRVMDLFSGPCEVDLAPDELLVSVEWAEGEGPQSFVRVSGRAGMGPAVASSCLVVDTERRTVRLALGGVAPTVVRAPAAEALIGEALGDSGWWDEPVRGVDAGVAREVGASAVLAAAPIDDVRATARYRRHAVGVLVERQVFAALGEAR